MWTYIRDVFSYCCSTRRAVEREPSPSRAVIKKEFTEQNSELEHVSGPKRRILGRLGVSEPIHVTEAQKETLWEEYFTLSNVIEYSSLFRLP